MSSITINIIDRVNNLHTLEAPTNMSMNLMEFLRANEFGIEGTCSGLGMCSTCHVYINSDNELVKMGTIEDMMLDDVGDLRTTKSRLSCQLHLTDKLNGLVLELPKLN
jgi:ferredoxin